MNTEERAAWLADRRKGLGGSDIAPMLGLSPYSTGYDLWLDKTGRDTVPPDAAAAERMHFGSRLESLVASEYTERTGRTVQRVNGILQHPSCPIALASIDRAIIVPGSRARWNATTGKVAGATGILECKTAHAMAAHSDDWGDAGTDKIPLGYWTQVCWYMGISGLPSADLAVLFGGQHFRIYTLAADASLFADLLTEADRWWREHVIADVPPQPTTEEDARRMWRSHVAGREKIVDVTVSEAVARLAGVKSQMTELERTEKELRDAITCAFGDAEAISYMGRKLATWKANKASLRTDWKALVIEEFEPAPQQIAAYTEEVPGARVLRLSPPPKEN